jgi:glycosyltransferase involved in cell wall biosynthesis
MPTDTLPPVTLIGFPFRTTGRGEHIRAVWRALTSVGVPARIHNLEPHVAAEDTTLEQEFGPYLIDTVPAGIRLYHLNGDEVPFCKPLMSRRRAGYFARRSTFASGHNIVFPAWELPHYPAAWARDLEHFDEVWAESQFIYDSIRPAVNTMVLHVPCACEPHVSPLIDRSYFGIPPNRYAILFFFDFRSYPSRKNPHAAIETFRRLRDARPDADVQFVLKLNRSSHDPAVAAEISKATAQFGDRITVIDATLSTNEVRNLVRCSDCFLSLHRSEGFGRGPAEAMFFGKPAIATGWSGNMEYMDANNSFPVRFGLIPVGADEYPFPQDQVWADPDVDHAAQLLIRLVNDPLYGKTIGERARAHMQANYSDAVLGARYRARFEQIASRARA